MTGEPVELLLAAYGRMRVADVVLDGSPEDVEALSTARSASPDLPSDAGLRLSAACCARPDWCVPSRARPPRQRTGWPSARSASLTWPMVSSPKWKTLAASTASAPARTAGAKSLTAPGPAAGDDGHGHLGAHQPDQLEVEAVLRAVGVHRVEQDLAGPELRGAHAPLDGVDAGAACARRGSSPRTRRSAGPASSRRRRTSADSTSTCAPNRSAVSAISAGPRDGGGVDPDLVGAGAQQPVDVVDGAHPSADGQRDEDLLGGARARRRTSWRGRRCSP